MMTQSKSWLGINISYDDIELKRALNGFDFKDCKFLEFTLYVGQ